MKKHTQGPWKLVPAVFNAGSMIQSAIIMSETGRITGVEFGTGVKDFDEMQANAALIAAAPVMLDTLKRIIKEGCFDAESNIGIYCTRAIALAETI